MKYQANPVIADAFVIVKVEGHIIPSGLKLTLDDGSIKTATEPMCSRYTPVVGDYWVVQEDGYVYLNPKDVFERTYDKILFVPGPYKGTHGSILPDGKIDCDALATVEIEWCASYIARRVKFFQVIPIPNGGNRLAEALQKYCSDTPEIDPILIVDDVLTTGKSMELAMELASWKGKHPIGYVIFARGPLPDWIKAIFYLEDALLL